MNPNEPAEIESPATSKPKIKIIVIGSALTDPLLIRRLCVIAELYGAELALEKYLPPGCESLADIATERGEIKTGYIDPEWDGAGVPRIIWNYEEAYRKKREEERALLSLELKETTDRMMESLEVLEKLAPYAELVREEETYREPPDPPPFVPVETGNYKPSIRSSMFRSYSRRKAHTRQHKHRQVKL